VFPAVPASVTSIDTATGDFTLGYGFRGQPGLLASLTSITASLGADVLLNNTANFFDGPSVAQGTTGTWFVVRYGDDHGHGRRELSRKLWDGTTVIASCRNRSAGGFMSVSLSGYHHEPGRQYPHQRQDIASTNGKIIFNVGPATPRTARSPLSE
jgi:hypothetical protein